LRFARAAFTEPMLSIVQDIISRCSVRTDCKANYHNVTAAWTTC